MEGNIGRVKPRNIQKLTAPWGLPETLRFVESDRVYLSELGLTKTSSMRELRDQATKWGVRNSNSKETLFNRLQAHEDELNLNEDVDIIPLRSISIPVAADKGPPKIPPFQFHEIVLKLGPDEDGKRIWVMDYEGRFGIIRRRFTDVISRPFGVNVSKAGMKPIMCVYLHSLIYIPLL